LPSPRVIKEATHPLTALVGVGIAAAGPVPDHVVDHNDPVTSASRAKMA
jgi:hypothetical protein